jgi:hypothetical protein
VFKGLDMRNVLLLDDLASNYVFNLNNSVPVLNYNKDNPSDKELVKLANYLKLLSKEDDIVEFNRSYFNFETIQYAQNIHQAYDCVLHKNKHNLEIYHSKKPRKVSFQTTEQSH